MIIREIAWGSPDYAAAVFLRNDLLCLPVGASIFSSDLRQEKDSFHFAAFDAEGRMTGTLILAPDSDTQFHVRQVAVLPAMRGQGTGHALMAHAEAFARARGVRTLRLDARTNARRFYLACGFTVCGEPFGRVDLRLTPMQKQL